MRVQFGVLTAVLSSTLLAGCYTLNPSEYVGPDGAASPDAPAIPGADVAPSDVSMGGTGGGGTSGGGIGGTGGRGGGSSSSGSSGGGGVDAQVPDVPAAQSDVSADGVGGDRASRGGMPDAPGSQPDVPIGGAGGGGSSGPGGSEAGMMDVPGAQPDAPAVDTGGGGLGENGDSNTTIFCDTPACLENWAAWPMPNSPPDVDAGAPNLESYTDNLDGTVTDKVTGLTWQQKVVLTMDTYAWADAVDYCASLTLAGRDDWRLPSVIELYSIVDVGQSAGPLSNASIDSRYFPSTPARPFWSSSPMAGYPSFMWCVDFSWGGVGGGGSPDFPVSTAVRCVRSASADAGAPAERYVVASDGTGKGTVYDTNTRLTWQQTAPSTAYTWATAKTYCADLGASLVGTGWRLPTIKELVTIVDYSQAAPPTIDRNAFPGTPLGYYLSSSPSAGSPPNPFVVDFSGGNTSNNCITYRCNVRCVR